jgi:septal ring factor EnvC (AmiA/AmiB activator)
MQDQMTAQERAFAAQQRTAQTERATAQIGMTPQERLAQEKANQTRLQGEVVGASQGAQSMAEIAARVAELNAEIAASKQIQAQLEKQIADEAERAAKATAAAQRSAMASAQSQAQANRVATMTPQEQLDFEMQGLADLQGFVGPEVEAQKQAAIGRIMALQSQIQNQGQGAMVGSFGASALQRIGFASNEFFDTRRREDPEKETKRAADAAKEILKILQGGEPLVLPSSN